MTVGVKFNPTCGQTFSGVFFCRFFFVRAGMMGWLLINLSILAKSFQDGALRLSMILYQLFCAVSQKSCMLSIPKQMTITASI